MRLACLASVALLTLTGGVATAEETVENPEFTTWSKFKKGTSITLKTTSTFGTMTTEITSTTTLVEVADDKLVVETGSVTKFNNMDVKAGPAKRDVPKTIPLPKGVKKEDLNAKKPPGSFEEGTETLKVGGTEIKTKWFKFKAEADGNKTEGKMWTSEDVPGNVVKMEATTTGTLASTLKMELTEFKKP